MNLFKELYQYRELLKTTIKKEIRGKYKGSAMGVLWSFVNPLLTVLVYAIVFPYIMRIQQENYLQFLICGVIPWTFFTTVIQQGSIIIRINAGIIKKVYFPREILPMSVAVSGYINFLISCIIVLIFILFGGIGISIYWLWVPVIGGIQMILSLGIILIIGSVNIYVKDVEYIVNFILQMLFYGTPILYSIEMFADAPKSLLLLVQLNPMTQIIQAYRDVLLYHQAPNIKIMIGVFFFSVFVLAIGHFIFKRLERGFAEEV